MSISSDLKEFTDSLQMDTLELMSVSIKIITKKLNKYYYGLDNDETSHMFIVGSIGRKSAIKDTSDLDLLFDLPYSVFERFDDYSIMGQSSLLQEVKNVLLERFPNSIIRGDGQVVVIDFSKYTVELVPGFQKSDKTFIYPDSNDGGSWKITDPLTEQSESKKINGETYGRFIMFCQLMRKWRNIVGFTFGGLLIDTLVYDCFYTNNFFKESSHFIVLLRLFEYLKMQNKDTEYWLALGSHQHVYNKDGGRFVTQATKAYSILFDSLTNEQSKYEALQELFGKYFANKVNTFKESVSLESKTAFRRTEEFIEDKYPVDISYKLQIDCKVTQNGFMEFLLSDLLRNKKYLRQNKRLEFFIERTNVPNPKNILWKVKNIGEIAENRDCIRGEIRETNKDSLIENTDFSGPHYVECYIVENGVCVARSHIDVPISTV